MMKINQNKINKLNQLHIELEKIISKLDHHYGSCISALDILISLYFGGIANFKTDKIIISEGHTAPSLYSILYKKGITGISPIGIKNGMPVHTEFIISGVNNFSGSLGNGIGTAIGIQMAKKTLHKKGISWVIVGDGEYRSGSTQECLSLIIERNISSIITVINANNLSFGSKIDNRNLVAELKGKGFETILIKDGHNFSNILRGFQLAKEKKKYKKTVAVIVKTKKGLNTKTEGDIYSHTFKTNKRLDQENFKKFSPQQTHWKTQKIILPRVKFLSNKDQHSTREVGYTLAQICNVNKSKLKVLCPDTQLSTKVSDCSTLEACGIREVSIPLIAAGLGMESIFPIISTFDCFAVLMLEKIKNSLWAPKLPFLLLTTHSGISIGSDGLTHFGILTIESMLTLGVNIFEPADINEAIACLYFILNSLNKKSLPSFQFYLRTARLPLSICTKYSIPIDFSKIEKGAYIIRGQKNDKIVIISSGVCINQAIEARNRLNKLNKKVKIINVVSVTNAIKSKELKRLIYKNDQVFIFYDGPSSVFDKLMFFSEINIPIKNIISTTFDCFCNIKRNPLFHCSARNIGDGKYLLDRYGLSRTKIIKTILDKS